MPDKSTYDFLDLVETGPGTAPQGPDLDETATRRSLGVPPPAAAKPLNDFVSRNYRGVPIDLTMESPTGLKTSLLMRERPEDKISFLEQQVGKGNVRFADDGTPLVTIWDEERKSPIEFNPLGQGANVKAHAMAALPETVGTIGGMIGGKKLPIREGQRFLKFAAEMIGAGVGEKAGATAKDIAVSGEPLGNIVAERFGEIPEAAVRNAALGGAATVGAKVLGRVISPFGGPAAPLEKGSEEAVQHFAEKFGIQYPRTIGERISSPLFKRAEATMSREPGMSETFNKIQRQKVEALRQIQAKMLSSKLDPTDVGMLRTLEEDVGEEAINTIRQSLHPLQRAQDIARNSAAKESHDALLNELEKAAGPARDLLPEQVGAKLRSGFVARRDVFDEKVGELYDEVYALPGGTERVLTPPNLARDAKKLLAEQPGVKKTTEVPVIGLKGQPVVGPTGQPLMSSKTGEEVLTPFLPEGVSPMLKSLAGTEGGEFSLRDLVKARTEVRNSIKKGEAIAGVDTHYLGETEDILTKAIDEATSQLPTPELRNAWQKANNFYRDNVGQFKEKNISRLARDKQTGAFVQDEDLVRNIGPSEYADYKKFFGANSDEFKALKRNIVDALIPNSGEGALIDPKEFLSRLYAFTDPRKNRAIAMDILGPQTTKNLEHISGLMKNIQEGDVVDRDSIVNLLMGAGQGRLASGVDELVNAQRNITKAYKSQIVRDIGEGKLGQSFDTTEFVNRLWDKASPGEIKAIKSQLAGNPKVLEDLERKVGERIFRQAQQAPSKMEPIDLATGAPARKAKTGSLEAVFGDEQNKAKLAELIGPERMQDFQQLAKLLAGSESTEAAFSALGSMSSQAQLHNLLRGGVLSYLPRWASQKLVATIYFTPVVREILTNQLGRNPRLRAAAVRAAVLSSPFRDAMEDDFGDKAGTVIDRMLDGLDLYETQGRAGAKAVAGQDWARKFLEEAEKRDPNRPRVTPIGP